MSHLSVLHSAKYSDAEAEFVVFFMTKMLGEKKMVRGLRSDKQMYLQIYRHITLQFKN